MTSFKKARKQPHHGVSKPSDGTSTSIDLESVPVRVENVQINGLSRTKDDYISQSVQELFKATSFKDVRLTSFIKLTDLFCCSWLYFVRQRN